MWGRMTPIKKGSTCLGSSMLSNQVGYFPDNTTFGAKNAAVESHLYEFTVASLVPSIHKDTAVAAVENS